MVFAEVHHVNISLEAMASNTWMAKLKYLQKLEGVHKWEKRWVAKGSMMVRRARARAARAHDSVTHTSLPSDGGGLRRPTAGAMVPIIFGEDNGSS